MSVLVRRLRQFSKGTQAVTLEKSVLLPDIPTMGARLDLRGEGVEDPMTVVGLTFRVVADGPGIRPPSVDVVLHHEPLAAAEIARSSGWRDQTPPEPEKI